MRTGEEYSALYEDRINSTNFLKDAEMNRAGMNGYRIPASKKVKKEVSIHCSQSMSLLSPLPCILILLDPQRSEQL